MIFLSPSLPRARRTTVTLHGFSIYGVTEIDRHLPLARFPPRMYVRPLASLSALLSTALIFSGRLRGCGVQAVLICMYLNIYLSLLYEARSSCGLANTMRATGRNQRLVACPLRSLQERLSYESTIVVASVSGSFQFHYECVRTTPHVAKRAIQRPAVTSERMAAAYSDPTRGDREG